MLVCACLTNRIKVVSACEAEASVSQRCSNIVAIHDIRNATNLNSVMNHESNEQLRRFSSLMRHKSLRGWQTEVT